MLPRVFIRALRNTVNANVAELEFALSEGEATDLLRRREAFSGGDLFDALHIARTAIAAADDDAFGYGEYGHSGLPYPIKEELLTTIDAALELGLPATDQARNTSDGERLCADSATNLEWTWDQAPTRILSYSCRARLPNKRHKSGGAAGRTGFANLSATNGSALSQMVRRHECNAPKHGDDEGGQSLSQSQPAATMRALDDENKMLRAAVRDLHWMARRYADMRSTYAPSMLNEHTRALLAAGVHIKEPYFARDGGGRRFDGLTEAEVAAAADDMPRGFTPEPNQRLCDALNVLAECRPYVTSGYAFGVYPDEVKTLLGTIDAVLSTGPSNASTQGDTE